jgi:hypothetical protein
MPKQPDRRSLLTSWSCLVRLVSVAATVGCGTPESPPIVETCPDDVVSLSVQNAASAAPSFTWTPACAVALLEVRALPDSGLVWSIDGRMQNILGTGIVYGQVPFGAQEMVAPSALEAGVSYEVRVARAVPTGGGVTLAGGDVATFSR